LLIEKTDIISNKSFEKTDMPEHRPTLDQLNVFLAIVEAGSFAAAARRLGRATSVISYTIANLEAQLGLELFDRQGTRKPSLTEAGRAILSDSRIVAMGLGGLVAKARGLRQGLEAEVTLVVDVMLPTAQLVSVLDGFSAAYPTVALRLHVEALGAVAQLVQTGVAGIGISGPLLTRLDDLVFDPIGAVCLVPVAAPCHPLARLGEDITAAATRDHIQLVLTDRSELTRGQDFQVMALRTWRLADLGAKHALLRAGIGWGSMPEAMVAEDIAAGRLVRLPLKNWDQIGFHLQVVHRVDTPPGPAARWLIDQFRLAARNF
jgi:DNA-binding transcriptional LysR family regulator